LKQGARILKTSRVLKNLFGGVNAQGLQSAASLVNLVAARVDCDNH
jgi:hypothetical protein